MESWTVAGGVAEWFGALDLKSGGPWFKSSTLLLSGFVLGRPEFNSSTAMRCVNKIIWVGVRVRV